MSLKAIEGLGQRLREFWQGYAACFKTRTRDTSQYGFEYLSGLLRMTTERNFTAIGRTTGTPGQNIQHFMTSSPWSAQAVLKRARAEIGAVEEFATGGMLLLDESADEKAGEKSVGVGRQYNGRMGKVEMSQVGTFLAYANGGTWTWVDGELFVPKHWFDKEMAEERKRLGLPKDRVFATKIALGWRMIERVVDEGALCFEAVACDTLYGRSTWLRRKIDAKGLLYMAEVPADTHVYLSRPVVGIPAKEPGRRGKAPTRPRVLSKEKPIEARSLAASLDVVWIEVETRATERGVLHDAFSARRVWTTHDGEPPVQEWLLMRRAEDARVSFALSNAPPETRLEHLAWLKCRRHFIECANRDAKSEAGWDDLRAQKFRAWEHHLALTVLATWFIAKTKHDWASQVQRDPALEREFEMDVLPALSMANVRELLRAVMPLPQLTPNQAADLVVEHLVNRARSRKSRLKKARHPASSP